MKAWLKDKRVDIYISAVVVSSITLGIITLWMMAQQYNFINYKVASGAVATKAAEEAFGSFSRVSIFAFSMIILALLLILAIGTYLSTQNIQRQMEVTKLKNDFLSTVSHELKTPLSAIRLLAERLSQLSPEESLKTKEYTLLILKQSCHLSRLINNILDFSKTEEGKEKFTFEKINLSELLKKSIEEYPTTLIRPDCRLELNFPSQALICCLDKEAICRAFANLLDNALKFSPPQGTVTVNVSKADKEAVIEVIDAGPGIEQEARGKIFEPFYHLGKGTGLGLTLAKRFVGAHKGKLVFESEKGRGAKFKIILPLIDAENPDY